MALLLHGCGSVQVDDYLPDKKVEYQKSVEVGKNLELPPDLTNVRTGSDLYIPGTGASGVATYSDFLGDKEITRTTRQVSANVLPTVSNISIKKEGDNRWLVIESTPQIVWPNVVSFWQEAGILLVEQDPTVGVMRTGWLENRADIKSDFITNQIRRVFDGLYSAATRDQYRVRLEEGDSPGTTELYLTHFGMEEQIKVDSAGEAERSIWIPRGNDPGLEAEMLRRLMVHLGVKEQRAQTLVAQAKETERQRSELVKNSRGVALLIDESFSRSWRLTGLALDRVGFAVEDRDRSRGLYFVRYNDPMADVATDEGWLSKLKFWGGGNDEELEDRYLIKVAPGNETVSQVVVFNEAGERLATETAARILTLIHEQVQ